MINVKNLFRTEKNGISFYTGKPDSVLKSLINFLSDKYKIPTNNNSEGSAVSLELDIT